MSPVKAFAEKRHGGVFAVSTSTGHKFLFGRGESTFCYGHQTVSECMEDLTKAERSAIRAAMRAAMRSRQNPTQQEVAQEVLTRHESSKNAAEGRIASLSSPLARVSGRIKKLDSLIEKMVRKPKYGDPTQLQDVTGIRVIEPSISDVKATVARIKARFRIEAEDDYIERPKDSYRSYHLIIRDDDGLLKEVQVRTDNQDKFSKWSHHVYKPSTAELAAIRDANRETIAEYERRMSAYFYERDLGFLRVKRPACPAVVAEYFGCIRDNPYRKTRSNPNPQELFQVHQGNNDGWLSSVQLTYIDARGIVLALSYFPQQYSKPASFMFIAHAPGEAPLASRLDADGAPVRAGGHNRFTPSIPTMIARFRELSAKSPEALREIGLAEYVRISDLVESRRKR